MIEDISEARIQAELERRMRIAKANAIKCIQDRADYDRTIALTAIAIELEEFIDWVDGNE